MSISELLVLHDGYGMVRGVGYVAALEKPGTARYLSAPAALIETVSGV